jgi:hypothetical protein
MASESEINTTTDVTIEQSISFDGKQISTDEQFSQVIESIDLNTDSIETSAELETNESIDKNHRPTTHTEIGAIVVKKLETLGN